MKNITIFLKGYPRISETFIAQEIFLLEKAGFNIQLVSLRKPTDNKRHKIHGEIKAKILYLPEYIFGSFRRCWRAWLFVRKLPNYKYAKKIWLQDLWRDFTPNRFRRFFQAVVVANELDAKNSDIFYAHFIHTPADVALYASIICNKDFAISAHAKDIWTSPKWQLEKKIVQAKFIVSCTKNGVEYLRSLTSNKQKIKLLYHGIDLNRFPKIKRNKGNNGKKSKVNFLTIGRMVEKKGFDNLLAALALLDKNIFWQLVHIGSGPLKNKLKSQAKKLGLENKIKWLGTKTQSEVLSAYKKADLFILPSKITADGDRDGLPNVIVEAQSQALAVVATNVSSIPELIKNNLNGILINANKPKILINKLAKSISMLATNPKKRLVMGIKGEKIVRKKFNCKTEIQQLIELFKK